MLVFANPLLKCLTQACLCVCLTTIIASETLMQNNDFFSHTSVFLKSSYHTVQHFSSEQVPATQIDEGPLEENSAWPTVAGSMFRLHDSASEDDNSTVTSLAKPTVTDSDPPCVQSLLIKTKQEHFVLWTEHKDICSRGIAWSVHVPSGHGIVVQIHEVVLKDTKLLHVSSLTPRNQGHGTWQVYTFTSNNISYAPLLERGGVLVSVQAGAKESEQSRKPIPLSSINISFTACPLTHLPQRIDNFSDPVGSSLSMYNCSTGFPVLDALRCDGVKQCVDNGDEDHCDYLRENCGDWVPYSYFRQYCLKLFVVRRNPKHYDSRHVAMPMEAGEECMSHRASLAMLPDEAGISLVGNLIRKSGALNAVIGIRKAKAKQMSHKLQHLYRYMWQWVRRWSDDHPIAYDQLQVQRDGVMLDCATLAVSPRLHLSPLRCVRPSEIPGGYVCMTNAEAAHSVKDERQLPGIQLPRPTRPLRQNLTKACADGSLVYVFHPCLQSIQYRGDLSTETGTYASPRSSSLNFPLFHCLYGPPVHYTLVCDGLKDCADGRDEVECIRLQYIWIWAKVFMCKNLQYVPDSKRCDGVEDCLDNSDEDDCTVCSGSMCLGNVCTVKQYAPYFQDCSTGEPEPNELSLRKFHPPVVQLDGYGMSTFRNTEHTNGTVDTEGLFLCTDGKYIPVYLLNNEERDCWEGEDEKIPVENFTCPGYYRCRDKGNCLHPDFVCDGIYHCALKDDEHYCDFPSPRNCTCEGFACSCHAFPKFTDHILSTDNFLYLRYLDVSGVQQPYLGMMHLFEFLHFLNISLCGLSVVSLGPMKQLQILDASFNVVHGLSSLKLESLPRLTHLNLSGNPLVKTLDSEFTAFLTDLSLTGLQHLVVTDTHVEEIEDYAFKALPHLISLDVRNNKIESYDKDVLAGLAELRLLFTDDQKLCCDFFHATLDECLAPVDELSSCFDLLRLDVFRVYLWVLSLLSVVGNVGVLAYRLVISRKASSSFHILVSNLCAADLCMGVCMVMIGAADLHFRGSYVANDENWRESSTCTAAGVLAFVSSEVSAFSICLITLDRFLVLCFPFKLQLHLGLRSCVLLSCLAWLCGFTLAAVPLVTKIQFYEQNGVCLPLPITRRAFTGQTYAFNVFVIFNFVLFLLIGAGQMAIYYAVRATRNATGNNNRQHDLVLARRLFLVVFSDFCCWFPIGVMGLMAFSGVPVPGQVNVWVAIFVLPLNSTLNPFLYTLNGLMEKRNRLKKNKKIKQILGNLQVEIPKLHASTVEDIIVTCIHSKKSFNRQRVHEAFLCQQDIIGNTANTNSQ